MNQPTLPGLTPPPAERWPRLSVTLPGPRDGCHCQACGARGTLPGAEPLAFGVPELQAWREHGDADELQAVFLTLCPACAAALIERHPRLYSELERHEPAPGIMPACIGCDFNARLRYSHPIARTNGGPGLKLTFPKPDVMHVDYSAGGRRRGKTLSIWRGAVKCEGRDSNQTGPGRVSAGLKPWAAESYGTAPPPGPVSE
jgi:hypothetical protein